MTGKIHTLLLAALLAAALPLLILAANHAAPSSIPAAEALAKLKAGNERFVTLPVSAGKPNAARRAATAQAQHPFAVIIACSDSRTPPELIFDENLGDLFVIRTAGNVIDDFVLGSTEYAVEHLGVRLIVILGHARCGAVKAAIASPTAPGHIGEIVKEIRPAVEAVQGREGDIVENSVKENITRCAAKITKNAELGEAAKEVRIIGGYYNLDTGKVQWFKP